MPSSKNRSVRTEASSQAMVQGSPGQPSTLIRFKVFPGLFGAILGLSLLKFGNPPITEKWVNVPTNIYEFWLGYPWPINWALGLLILVSVMGLFVANWKVFAPRWLVGLPLIWFGWQMVSATQTVDAELTKATVKHFAACIVCFYLGCFALNQSPRLTWFWLGLIAGFVLVLAIGWEQHFGGLEETRRYFFLYIYPTMKEISPGYFKKMSSNRIFSTLFYPNALAGVILLLLPATLGLIQANRRYFTKQARIFLQSLVSVFALSCLYWSGSKGGWLLIMLLGIVTLLQFPFGKRFKLVIAAAVLAAGLGGFFWKYSTFFQKGATSVSARFDYWQAASHTAARHPVFGTGPGTFFIPYMEIKRPESEPARLVHNDYLEQASDSGVVGFLSYAAFIVTGLAWTFKKCRPSFNVPNSDAQQNWLLFGIWLGLVGWALQGFIEFGLYIPGEAWPAFALFGWLMQVKMTKSE
jgi:O-antigen ligase